MRIILYASCCFVMQSAILIAGVNGFAKSNIQQKNCNKQYQQHHQTSQRNGRQSRDSTLLLYETTNNNDIDNNKNNEQEDLFDYFDPLMSPHSYPDGINSLSSSSEKKQQQQEQQQNCNDDDSGRFYDPFGIQSLIAQQQKTTSSPAKTESNDNGDHNKKEFGLELNNDNNKDGKDDDEAENVDFLDGFDPRLSPHMYPDGTDGAKKEKMKTKFGFALPIEGKEEIEGTTTENNTDNERHFGFNLSDGDDNEEEAKTGEPLIKDDDLFDPTLSPHMYPNGTPAKVVAQKNNEKKTKRIGVLLIDHGSKNIGSNERLHSIAQKYQMKKDNDSSSGNNDIDNTYVVRGAHMEIANPSIPEAIASLIQEENVDEIICHPFFLSPRGRHVSEDIPEIIGQVKESLKQKQEENEESAPPTITLTEPTGANDDKMISIIDSIVTK